MNTNCEITFADQIIEFCRDQKSYVTNKVSHQPKLNLGMQYNQCVQNAYDYSKLYPNWQICAGWHISIEDKTLYSHAWNKKNKKHRDITPMRLSDGTQILLEHQPYIVSEHYTDLLKKNIDDYVNGDESLRGWIHPNFSLKDNQWVGWKYKTNEEMRNNPLVKMFIQ